jgi:hypothetical protein
MQPVTRSPAPWPFAPLTEAQHRAQAAQACALRNADRRAHYTQLQAARAALASLAQRGAA